MPRQTREELEAQLQKTQKELEELENHPPVSPSAPAPSPSQQAVSPSQSVPSPSKPSPSQPASSPSPSAPAPSPSKADDDKDDNKDNKKKDDVDWRKRYIDSTRQGQKLYESNKVVNEAIEKGNSLALPTDEECKTEYPDWDKMDSIQKRLGAENLLNKKKFQLITQAIGKVKSTHAWGEKVTKFVEDPATLTDYPEIDGLQEEFKIYAEDKEGVVTDLRYLVPSFVRDRKNKKTPKKGQMFESGSGGDNKRIPITAKIPHEQALVLKKTDFRKWKKLLQEGRIENPIADAK